MDKLKIILAIVKKHHFWALCGLVLVVSLVVWWKARGSLAEQFTDRKDALEGDFGKMAGITGELNHPNEEVVEKISQETAKLRGEVFVLWDSLYQEQKEKNKFPATLRRDFGDYFWNLDAEIPLPYREDYRQFITGGHFKQLFEEELNVLRPREQPDGESAAGGPNRAPAPGAGAKAEPGSPPPTNEKRPRPSQQRGAGQASSGEEEIGVVRWVDRNALEARFRWTTVPTDEQVRNAQEDLWVIEALVRIIKRTNGGASGPHNAAIKEIESVEIGAKAVGAWRISEQSVIGMGTAKHTDSSGQRPGTEEGRYVDEDGELIAPDEDSPYAEFKMMPICMRLVMDQTRIPELLVECANSELPIEVRSVRLRPGEGDQFDLSTASAEGAGGSAAGGAGLHVTPARPANSLDVPIEIQGIIYIYNPPDEEKLGTGTAAEKPAPEVTPTPPSATPATPPPGGK